MGCSLSGGTTHDGKEVATGINGARTYGEVTTGAQVTLERYLRLEHDLWCEEKAAPAPTLHHASMRLDAAMAALVAARQWLGSTAAGATTVPAQPSRTQSSPVDTSPQLPEKRSGSLTNDRAAYLLQNPFKDATQMRTSLQEVLLDLKIDRNSEKAAEHEEFVANINRQELARNEVTLLARRVEEAEEEVKIATAKVNFLQELYERQDQLLGEVFGEQYGSAEERRLELRLDRLRSFRDTLAGGELEWREAHALATSAADDMRHAVAAWERLAVEIDAEARMRLLLQTRERAQAAAAAAAAAHAALPGAGLPACTPRELAAVAHALVYIFTDAQDVDKAAHAGRLYRHFWLRACELADWIRKTMTDTLQKDLTDIDLQVAEATSDLRAVRVQLIREKLSFSDPMPLDDDRWLGKVLTPPFGATLNAPYPSAAVGSLAGLADDPTVAATAAADGKGRRRLQHSVLFAGSGSQALYGPHLSGAHVGNNVSADNCPDALHHDLVANLHAASTHRWSGSKGVERRLQAPPHLPPPH